MVIAAAFLLANKHSKTGAGFNGVGEIKDSMELSVDSNNVEINLASKTAASNTVSAQAPISNLSSFKHVLSDNIVTSNKDKSGKLVIPSVSPLFEINTNYFVVRANLGRWNGRFESGKIMTDGWKDFLRVIEDYDNLEIVDNNGHLEIVGTHHDSRDYFEIRELTHKGYEYVNIYYYGKSDSELAQAVWNNFRSRLPRLAARA